MLREDAGTGERVDTMIRVLDLDSRQEGAGDLTFKFLGEDSPPFLLNATPMDGGWWDVAVETATVREPSTAMTPETSTSFPAVLL